MDECIKKLLIKINYNDVSFDGFFANYPVLKYFIEGDSTIIIGKSDHKWVYLISRNEEELKRLLKIIGDFKYFSSIEEWMVPIVLADREEDWIFETNRFILDKEVRIDKPKNKVVSLSKDNAEYVYDHSYYQDYTGVEYFRERLDKDISAGIFENGKLVAWGFTHDDGALGSLFVLNDHRKKGYGRDIILDLISKNRIKDRPNFANIELDNLGSINLFRKLGFRVDRKIFWIKLK